LCILETTIVKFRNLKQGTKMTKMIKMSLIAAVAVTGLTTTVSAQNLEDAIKGVDFSGNLRYRYTNGEATITDTNEYRLEMTVKSKVNDMVTATVSTIGKASTGDSAKETTGTKRAGADVIGDGDPVAANIAVANFTFALPGATVIAGKQALATPFASGQLEDQQGTGVVALVPVAGVTLAGGLYLNSDAYSKVYDVDLGKNNIAAVAAIGKASVVDYAVWYAKVSENAITTKADGVTAHLLAGHTAGATALNLNIKVPVGPANIELNHAKVSYTVDKADAKEPSLSKLVVSGKAGDITLAAGYLKAGKDSGDVTLGDDDSAANFKIEKFSAQSLADTTAIYFAAGMPVGPVTAKLEYGKTSALTGGSSLGASEAKLSVAYAVSKNFGVSAWMTDCSDALDGKGQNRIELKYTF
jgi:hypothetical protein